jgi:hypothetical protein
MPPPLVAATPPPAPVEPQTVAPLVSPVPPAPVSVQTDEPAPQPQLKPAPRKPIAAKKKRARTTRVTPLAPAPDPIAQLFGGLNQPKPAR